MRLFAWGEMHVLMGMVFYYAGSRIGELPYWLAPAILLSIASHWMLDDLNVGAIARIYHGTGDWPWVIITSLARIPIIGAIAWITWHEPLAMACGLPAWLILDHEWALNLFGRHGYGLHERMWAKWLHTKWGLIPKFIALGLLVWLVL